MTARMSINRVDLTDEESLLVSPSEGDDSLESREWFKNCRVYYTLPSLRVSTLVALVTLCDVIALNTLWLTGTYCLYV